MNNIFNLIKVFFKQRDLIQNSQNYTKFRVRFNNGSIIDKGNYNLYHMDTKSFKIIYPEYLKLEEIERLEKIENLPLIQSLREEKNLLKKSYLNEFGYAYEEIWIWKKIIKNNYQIK